MEAAAKLGADRATVVDIGKTRLDLPWNAYYDKELDVRFSRSYGPGRYDERYELEGVDYPAGYVRWTERRNLECFLDLLARKAIDVSTLINGAFPLDQAASVYKSLADGTLPAVGVLLEYDRTTIQAPSRRLIAHPSRPAAKDRLSVGFIGAGNYASSMLLPHLARYENVRLTQVATTRSLSAVNAQRKFGFETASTEVDSVLQDDSLDAIFIVTRHRTHASLVCRALETGKAVFVEKPLALTRAEIAQITETVETTGNDRLMVGFNRRFAPLLTRMRSRFGTGQSTARYLVNAGPLAADSWYNNVEAEGSRFTGEGGHFIDTLAWWLDSIPVSVYASGGTDPGDVVATIRFGNGTSGTIHYLTGGNARFPKETFDATGTGRTARLDNFTSATVWSGRGRDTDKSRVGQDKGQRSQLDAFVSAVTAGGPMPIGIESLLAVTAATIAAHESMLSGNPEPV